MKKRGLLIWLSLILAALPGLRLSYLAIQEPWTLFRLARVTISIPWNHIIPYATAASAYRVEHLGMEFLDAALLLGSNWPLEYISLVPLGSLFLSIAYFALAYHLSRSESLAILMALYVGWYYPRLVSQYSIQTYVWTHLLFIAFLLVFREWIARQRVAHSILIMLLFVITFLFYQTTPFWIIVALIVASVLRSLKKRQQQASSGLSWALPMFCLVIYLTFDSVLYTNFLQRIVSEVTHEELLQSLSTKILAPLFQTSPRTLRPYEIAPLSPPLATWSTLISLIIMTLPIAIWVITKIVQAVRFRNIGSLLEDDDIWIWSVLAIAISHAVGYSTYGAVSTRVIPLAFPFVLLLLPRSLKLRNDWLAYTCLIALVLVSVVGFLSYSATLLPDVKPSDLGDSIALLPNGSILLADAGVFGAYQVRGATQGKALDLVWLDSEKYSIILQTRPQTYPFDWIIADKYGKPLITSGWIFLEPWSNYEAALDRNPSLERIYDSDYLTLYQPASRPLPVLDIAFLEESRQKPVFPWLVTNMVGTLSLITFLPGILLLALIQTYSPIDIEGHLPISTISLALGTGLAILAGYFVNFTLLGITSLIWVLLGISCVLIIALFLRGRKSLSLLKSIFGTFWLLVSLLAAWTLLFTLIAQHRPQKEYLEFYATQSPAANNLSIRIANHGSQPLPFLIIHTLNEASIGSITATILPNQKLNYELNIQDASGVMKLTLYVQNLDALHLHFEIP